jgi:hypothetical protein
MSQTGQVPVYNPLGAHMAGYGAYREWQGRRRPRAWLARIGFGARPNTLPQAVMDAYRAHLAARTRASPGIQLPDRLAEDRSELADRARSFCEFVASRTDPPAMTSGVRLLIPRIGVFDGRCLEVGGKPAVFVTSNVLEVVRFFANTVSLCTRLNALAAPVVLTTAEETPQAILLAWETVVGSRAIVQQTLDLLSGPFEGDPGPALSQALARPFDWMDADTQQGMLRSSLSLHLMQAAIQVLGDVTRGRERHQGVIAAATAPAFAPSDSAVDSEYLALLVLAYIYLHELGHATLRHSWLRPPDTPVDTVMREIGRHTMAFAKDEGAAAVDFLDTVLSHEIAADTFALGVADDDLRHPLLEAATLWCAALAGGNSSSPSWWPEEAMASEGLAHPPFAMRVWQMNGRYSTGARQGWVAQEITRRAESVTERAGAPPLPAAALERAFPALWRVALRAVRA